MTKTDPTRTSAGVPAGGEFVAHTRLDGDIKLAGVEVVNHVVNDSGPKTWEAIEDAIGSFNKGWPGPPSWRLDADRPPLVYTTNTGDPALVPGWDLIGDDDI